MRTTLKRGVGRGAELNGNGHSVFPPGPISPIVRYRQPPRPPRSGIAFVGRILLVTLLVLVALALGGGGAAYLFYHQSVNAVRAHSPDVKVAEKQLKIALPGQAAIGLLLGYDARAGIEGFGAKDSRSDTIMLVRADPSSKTISMLSFPRDLIVPIYCPGQPVVDDRINSAFTRCGPKGTLDTVRHLTNIPVNYLITVNFHGFKEIVDQFGGVWLDIDRRYYNKNTGTAATDFANINLQPGYQLVTGGSALEFVRYRHTDSDLYRLARQQEFLRALKQQVSQHFSLLQLPKIVSTITHNVEVGGRFDGSTVLKYALLAATLPGGHMLQIRINDVTGYAELSAPTSAIQSAVQQFENPDVGESKLANATALGERVKSTGLSPRQTTLTVLNGSGVAGAAASATYLLGGRQYVVLQPPRGLEPNAPRQNYFQTEIYFNARKPASRPAALALQKLLQPAEVLPLPHDRTLRALDPGSLVLVVLGTTFHDALTAAAPAPVVTREPAVVRFESALGLQLLQPLERKVPFRLEVPTVLESSSYPDTCCGDVPVRLYSIVKGKKAVRLVFKTAGNEYWGVEETNWLGAPVLGDRSFSHDLGGREFQLYYSGTHLHMAVLNANGASYWVVNTLLDSLSNETMLAIARGLRPLPR